MNNPNRNKKYNVSTENNQLVLILNSGILLPEDAPVRVASAQLEELDYRKLYEAYSSRGRKSGADPRILFKAIAYGYQCGIYSTRKLEEACKYRVDFMWHSVGTSADWACLLDACAALEKNMNKQIELIQEAVQMLGAVHSGNAHLAANLHANLGALYHKTGCMDLAKSYMEQGVLLMEEYGSPATTIV